MEPKNPYNETLLKYFKKVVSSEKFNKSYGPALRSYDDLLLLSDLHLLRTREQIYALFDREYKLQTIRPVEKTHEFDFFLYYSWKETFFWVMDPYTNYGKIINQRIKEISDFREFYDRYINSDLTKIKISRQGNSITISDSMIVGKMLVRINEMFEGIDIEKYKASQKRFRPEAAREDIIKRLYPFYLYLDEEIFNNVSFTCDFLSKLLIVIGYTWPDKGQNYHVEDPAAYIQHILKPSNMADWNLRDYF